MGIRTGAAPHSQANSGYVEVSEGVWRNTTFRSAAELAAEREVAAMGVPAPPRPVPAPRVRSLTREQAIEEHCWSEARREVRSWFTGELYEWTEFSSLPVWSAVVVHG